MRFQLKAKGLCFRLLGAVANEHLWAGRHFSNPCVLESTIYDSVWLGVCFATIPSARKKLMCNGMQHADHAFVPCSDCSTTPKNGHEALSPKMPISGSRAAFR